MSIKNKNKITRRKLLKRGLYGTVAAGLSPALWVSGCSKLLHKDRPNIIFIVIDTLRADYLPTYGHKINPAPYMDSLAREGVVFERVIAPSTWTKTSMASIVTSIGPAKHRVRGVNDMLPGRLTTIAEGLSAKDYQTIGVNANPWLQSMFGFDVGFDKYISIPMRLHFYYPVWAVNAKAFSLMENVSSQKPLFLYLHLMDPHSPYVPAPPYYSAPPLEVPGLEVVANAELERRFRQDGLTRPQVLKRVIEFYEGEIKTADAGIKQLYVELQKAGILDNAVVIITSDHGEEFLEHGQVEHGKNFYPETYEVPLIFHAPGRLPSAKRIKPQVRLIDIAPTIFELANVRVPEAFEGRSLLPMDNQAITPRIATGAVGLNDSIPDLDYTTVVSEEYLYIREKNNNKVEFYDLRSDPAALKNLGKSHPKAALFARLEDSESARSSEQTELDAETIRHLESLGYLKPSK
jgi:arylsulfatase A-like enzyme